MTQEPLKEPTGKPKGFFRDFRRPYDGQGHTPEGLRGQQEVTGLTMRDIGDCLIRAFYLSSGLPDSSYPDGVYELPLGQMDAIAIMQNLLCEVERRMGIFPNIPRLLGVGWNPRWEWVECSKCQRSYKCTPQDDYYNSTNSLDGVCESCLLKEHGVKKLIEEI